MASTNSKPTQDNKTVAIQSPLGKDVLLLQSVQGREELGRLFQFDVDLLSEDNSIDFDKIVGQNVTLRLNLPSGGARYWNGYVSEFCQMPAAGALASYRATVVPWLWFLTRTSDCRIFQDLSVPDILKKIFQDFGFSALCEDHLSGSYAKWDYCVQYRETAFNFVSRLMEQEGIYYYFTHENGKHLLILCDSPSRHEPLPGYEQWVYRPDTQAQGEKVTAWTARRVVQPTRYAHTDYNFNTPSTPLLAKSQNPQKHVQNQYEVFDFPGEYAEKADGEHLARIRAEELFAGCAEYRGTGDVRGVAPGSVFTLLGHPRQDQERKYLVVEASYRAGNPDYGMDSGPAEGPTYACEFMAKEAEVPFRSARVTPKPVVQGVQTAVVVGPAGQEIYVDDHARVKVQFHWDRYGKRDEKSSCWIRATHPWAGKGYGAMSVPRIGQEVVIDFVEGDPDQPLINGRLYNAEQGTNNSNAGRKTAGPSKFSEAAMMTSLKSNSLGGSGGSNEITMNDTGGSEGLFIKAQKDEIHTVGNNRDDTVGNNETRSVAVNRTRSVGSNEEVTVGANQKITVGSNQDVEVGAAQSIKVGASQKTEVGAGQTLSVGANREASVGGGETISVKGDQKTTVGAACKLTVGAGHDIVVSGAQKTDASGGITLNSGAEIKILSGAKITLSAGAGTIEISAGGVKISGPVVDVTGGTIKNNG